MKKISVPEESARALFGIHDENLKSIEKALGVQIVSRGDELLVEARLVSRRAEWRRLLPAADLVLADALSAGVVREARPRRLRELRILGDADLARVRKSLNRAESAA